MLKMGVPDRESDRSKERMEVFSGAVGKWEGRVRGVRGENRAQALTQILGG